MVLRVDYLVKICLIDEIGIGDGVLFVLVVCWGLEYDEDNLMVLVLMLEYLELCKCDELKFGGIFVDFVGGVMVYCCKFGGGCGEVVVKVVGIKGDYLLDVVDVIVGLGCDVFVLVLVGCCVWMLECNLVVVVLFDDGLVCGYVDAEIGGWLQEWLQLIYVFSLMVLIDIILCLQVVYFDLMFLYKQKSVLVKKEMCVFQLLVGLDFDVDGLLEFVCLLVIKCVVVKCLDYVLLLVNVVMLNVVVIKGYRFDIYVGTLV